MSLSIIQSVSGFSVSSLTIDPTGDLNAGTPVTITFYIGDNQITTSDTLVITTDLKNPVWTYEIYLSNLHNPSTTVNGNPLKIAGWLINYPSDAGPVNLDITLKGTVPSKPSASKNLLKIVEVDSKDSVIAYPPGFNLPMPVKTTLKPIHTIKDTTTDTPASTDTMIQIENTETEAPISTGTGNETPEETASPRFTTRPSNTPTPASPVNLLGIIGAVGIAFLVMKK
jgi:hypothetical protein